MLKGWGGGPRHSAMQNSEADQQVSEQVAVRRCQAMALLGAQRQLDSNLQKFAEQGRTRIVNRL